MSIKPFIGVVLIIWLLPLSAMAQQQAQTGQDNADTTPSAEQAEDAEQAPAIPDGMPDIDNQPIQRPDNQSPGRFIPSEQISQDLGVSFPVDI